MIRSTISKVKIPFGEAPGQLSAILQMPEKARYFLLLAHGAGAGMDHPFLENLAQDLAGQGIATLRFQFPYMEQGKKRPDSPKIAKAAIQAALGKARQLAGDLPILAGGKSFGGRMASQLAAEETLPGLQGLVFFGFPLHAPGKPSIHRADHLKNISIPLLFLQGTRDTLADIGLMEKVCNALPKATLEIMEGGDHSFKTLKRSGISHEEMIRRLAERTAAWAEQ